MRNFIVFILLLIFGTLLWALSFPRSVNENDFLGKEVLAKAQPFSVKIDVDFLKSLGSAYDE